MDRTIRKTTNDITKKLTTATKNAHAGQLAIASTLAAFNAGQSRELNNRLTTVSTNLPKAPPTSTATARSTTLQRLMKALKSVNNNEVVRRMIEGLLRN